MYFILTSAALAVYSRYLEKEADMISAAKTGQIEGGISFFEKFAKIDTSVCISDIFNSYNPLRVLANINWAIQHTLFPDHPSHETRIAYLKELQK